jgi:hypothetical protein
MIVFGEYDCFISKHGLTRYAKDRFILYNLSNPIQLGKQLDILLPPPNPLSTLNLNDYVELLYNDSKSFKNIMDLMFDNDDYSSPIIYVLISRDSYRDYITGGLRYYIRKKYGCLSVLLDTFDDWDSLPPWSEFEMTNEENFEKDTQRYLNIVPYAQVHGRFYE